MILPALRNIILFTAPKFPLPISPQSTRSSAQKWCSSVSENFSFPVDWTYTMHSVNSFSGKTPFILLMLIINGQRPNRCKRTHCDKGPNNTKVEKTPTNIKVQQIRIKHPTNTKRLNKQKSPNESKEVPSRVWNTKSTTTAKDQQSQKT